MDTELRAAERRASGEGPQGHADVLRHRVRAGQLQVEHLKIAALLGNLPAALAAGVPPTDPSNTAATIPGNWALAIHNQARLGEFGWDWRHELYRRIASALNDTLVTRTCRCSEPVRTEVRNCRLMAWAIDSMEGSHEARAADSFVTTSTTFVPIPGTGMTLPPGFFRLSFQAEVLGEAVVQLEMETEEGASPLASQAFAFFADGTYQAATIEYMNEFLVQSVIRASIRAVSPACESWRIMYEILHEVDPNWEGLEDVAAWVLE